MPDPTDADRAAAKKIMAEIRLGECFFEESVADIIAKCMAPERKRTMDIANRAVGSLEGLQQDWPKLDLSYVRSCLRSIVACLSPPSSETKEPKT